MHKADMIDSGGARWRYFGVLCNGGNWTTQAPSFGTRSAPRTGRHHAPASRQIHPPTNRQGAPSDASTSSRQDPWHQQPARLGIDEVGPRLSPRGDTPIGLSRRRWGRGRHV